MLGIGLGLTSPAVLGGAVVAYTPVDATAVIDLDFIRQQYWWGGALKTTANFTSFNLNGSTLDATGLTPSATVDITLLLATVGGTYAPGAMAVAATNTSVPGTSRVWVTLDNGGTTERIPINQNTAAAFTVTVVAGNVSQANLGGGSTSSLSVKHGYAASYDVNNVMGSGNGVAGVQDTVATMPTLTTLRVGKSTVASTNPLGALARVLVFTAAKTQAELNTLSVAMRDNS